MKQSIFVKYFLPFLQWYAVMIGITILIDYVLHYFHLDHLGQYLGYVGVFLIALSFIYSLRKRKIIKSGSPKKLLALHEYLAWAGSILILVHAGIHFNALLPWLAIFMLLIVVATGLIGKFLLMRASETLNEKKKSLMQEGMSLAEAEKELFFDSFSVSLMRKWRTIHLPMTLLLGLLALIHIVAVIMYSK